MKIEELTLYSENLNILEVFYHEKLGLEILSKSSTEISFSLKNSILKFIKTSHATPYHVAFTISSNKIEQALEWLKNRVDILKNKDEEIVDFPAWNAESIYFYDPDKNIIEFIARKNLNFSNPGNFTSKDIIEISEIGLATDNFDEKLHELTSIPNLKKFFGGDSVFCAIGSERGLFILIDKKEKNWFPANDKAFASTFNVVIKVKNRKIQMEYENGQLNYTYF